MLNILTDRQKQLLKYKAVEIIKNIGVALFILSWGIVPS